MSRNKAKKGVAVLLVVSLGVVATTWLSFVTLKLAPDEVQASSNATVSAPLPRFVTLNLAQVNLEDTDKHLAENRLAGKYDAEKDYSLVFGDGPDNWEHILTLRPGSAWPGSQQELAENFAGVHLNLVTGRGVAIGDTPQQVELKIGRPTRKTSSEYEYIHEGRRRYRASYRFDKGKLTAIQFVYTKASAGTDAATPLS